MSAIAQRLALGHLSADEQDVAPPDEQPLSREMHEQLLYEHLHVAQQARLRMDAAKSWNQTYHKDFTDRDRAIRRARVHYEALREMGAVDPFLDRMAINEEINKP